MSFNAVAGYLGDLARGKREGDGEPAKSDWEDLQAAVLAGDTKALQVADAVMAQAKSRTDAERMEALGRLLQEESVEDWRSLQLGMCLCLLGIALALLVQPSTAWDFARGVPGLKDGILAKRHPLHAGVARRAGAAQEDNSGQDRRDLEEVVAEADRVLEDNGTVKETKAVLRKAQKIYPGKWTLSGKKDELQQKLREFVEEAKATKKGLEEDSHRAQVTSWHPGRGGVASRASPQQDSGAEDWLAKSREEVEGFCRTGSKPYCWMLGLKQTTSPKSPPFC
ncbi:unnamed protein product [Effrenium voratum]|uniref:Uncharacterized protein n=1 Tax=Effrenium voratum TaxID=2562239 RepID=A0AA36I031_9DINO|nr:unnamed protein product [Effrenium voratum]